MSTETADYGPIVMEHFTNPRNVGLLADADTVGVTTNPVCGDMLKLYLKIVDGRITAARFKTYGCGAAIAASSMVTTLLIGRSLAEARALTRTQITAALGGLPDRKLHCADLGEAALQDALVRYEAGIGATRA